MACLNPFITFTLFIKSQSVRIGKSSSESGQCAGNEAAAALLIAKCFAQQTATAQGEQGKQPTGVRVVQVGTPAAGSLLLLLLGITENGG